MERGRPSQAVLARRFNCSQSAISKITDALLQEEEENKSASCKRKRSSKDDDVDEALFTWFVDAMARDLPITSAVLDSLGLGHSARILWLRMGGSADGISCNTPAPCSRISRLME